MKIAYITTYPPKNQKHSYSGGVASYSKNLITNIPLTTKDKIYIFCNKINKYETYQEDNSTVIRCFDKNINFISQIQKEIKKINPDIIHIQHELALFGNILTACALPFLLFKLKKYNTIITIHGVLSLKDINKQFIKENNYNAPVFLVKFVLKKIFTSLCKYVKKIIVHEGYFKNILVNEFQVNKNKIFVIPHGVEKQKIINKKTAAKKININPNKNIILFMGYLTGYKGIDKLIKGFSVYAKKDKNSFLIIGAGKHPKLHKNARYLKLYQSFQKLAQDIIPKNQYIWKGFIKEKEILYYYNASDVVIFPYTNCISSSGPLAISVGYKKPFLVSDSYGKIFDNKNIVFKNNPASITNKLKNFFQNKNIYKKISENLYKAKLWSKVAKKTYNLYKNI